MKLFKAVPVSVMLLGWIVNSSAQSADMTSIERGYHSTTAIPQSMNIERLDQGYCEALQSENRGVVESALAYVARLKLVSPRSDFGKIRRQLEIMKDRGATAELRYKAYVASVLFEHPELFRNVDHTRYEESNELFCVLANRMQEIFLTFSKK